MHTPRVPEEALLFCRGGRRQLGEVK
jgi:hypothetical protein